MGANHRVRVCNDRQQIVLPAAQKAVLVEQAARQGVSISEFIRRAITRATSEHSPQQG